MSLTTSPSSNISLNVVPARTGIAWVKMGIKTFFKQPLALGGLFFMNVALTQILGLLPGIGFILAVGLIPAFNAGLLVATQQAEQNKFPMPLTLFSAFRQNKKNTKSILTLGVIYVLIAVVLITLFNLIFIDPSNSSLIVDGKINEKLVGNSDFQLASMVVLTLQLPIGMLFWHAPALVHWHEVSPIKALFFSFVACFKNLSAMVVYFSMWLVVFLLGGFILTVVTAAIGSESILPLLILPAGLLMAAMFFTSIYFSFKDSFTTENTAVSDVIQS
jgi:hypothetical protein